MRPSLVSRLADRTRRALGLDELRRQLESVDGRLAGLEGRVAGLPSAPTYPRGPLYFGDHTALVATRWGAKMLVDTRDAAIAPWLVLDGMWEPHVTSWMQSVLGRGQVFVDVGANVGYFTLLGAQLVGQEGLVVAVEAHPQLAAILQRNVVINGVYGYVTCHHKAAWSQNTELRFNIRENFAGNSSAGTIAPADMSRLGDTERPVTVEAVVLDDLLEDLPRVDVIKVDVEGAEVHVFQGLRRILAANPAVVVMFEWAPAQIESVGDHPDQLIALMEEFGFGLRLLETGAEVDGAALKALPYGNVVASR